MRSPLDDLVLSFLHRAEALRSRLAGIGVQDVLARRCDSSALEAIDEFVLQVLDAGLRVTDAIIAPDVAARLGAGESAWTQARDYCTIRLDDDVVAPAILIDCLLLVFPSLTSGVWIGPDMLGRTEPSISADDDGLMVDLPLGSEFTKLGLVTEQHWIRYARGMPGVGLTDGFIDALLHVAHRLAPNHLGFALESAVVLDRDYHHELETRAFIRGPVGLSGAMLDSHDFPEDSSGTVTVHQRVEDVNPWCPLLRTEFMWSRKDNVKTMQIEELQEPSQDRRQGFIENRYVHARWDTIAGKIVHFDGAIRAYDRGAYQPRLTADLHSYAGKPAAYRKLFRIDGVLPLAVWSDLVVRYFDQNELVLEYFGGPAAELM